MKICPTCNRTYTDETLAFCLDDGAALAPFNDPHATLQLPDSRRTSPAPTEVLPPATRPPLQPTLTAPPTPFYSEPQPRQPTETRGGSTKLVVGTTVLGIVLGVGITVVFFLLRKDGATSQNSNSVSSNTREILRSTPTPSPRLRFSRRFPAKSGRNAKPTVLKSAGAGRAGQTGNGAASGTPSSPSYRLRSKENLSP